ncbi:hypothetical protein PS662_05260 [Pseudomonas fluorescens]|uniref:Uncharacterized protein n=1 Tax=Pseudomonas fluorescens TaxID=294 RepID=A0A5E6X7S2_PSEFL|nr:hypothetical protein PS662_05260 [Pseudomonas fluorescens]
MLTHDRLRSRRANLLDQRTLAAELRFGMNLDQTVGTHEIDLAALTEAEVVDQLRQLFHAQPEPGNAHDFAGLFNLEVDEQRQFSGRSVIVDIESAWLVAIEEGIEPSVFGIGAAESPVQAFFSEIVV